MLYYILVSYWLGGGDMAIRIQYPYIYGNALCDGTIHQIEPNKLSHIIGLSLFVLEYFDYKVGTQCITILSADEQGFHKNPLLGYNELLEILNTDGWLEPVDIGILPSTIGTKKPVHDWPALIAANSVCISNNSPMLYAAAGDNNSPRPSWPFRPFRPSRPSVRFLCREVITLYIDDDGKTVKRKRCDSAGHIEFQIVSYESLYRLLGEYDIIWRHNDETLVTMEKEIDLVLRICESRLSNETVFYQISEIDLASNSRFLPLRRGRRLAIQFLPPYYGHCVHRYCVNIIRR